MLIDPMRQRQGAPASGFVQYHLSRFNRLRVAVAQAADRPDVVVWRKAYDVGPEESPGVAEFRPLEQKARVSHRHIIGIEQQHLAETRMHQSVGFEFPAAEPLHLMA